MRGFLVGGLGAGAGRDFTGIGLGGLAFGAGDDLTGLAVGGLAVGAGDVFRGVGIGGLAVGGVDFKGIALSLAHTRSEAFSGLAVSAYNRDTGLGEGLFLGLFNYCAELHGVQLGLLNYAGNNTGWKKWLPFINMHFD
jgi:hypothetical protein